MSVQTGYLSYTIVNATPFTVTLTQANPTNGASTGNVIRPGGTAFMWVPVSNWQLNAAFSDKTGVVAKPIPIDGSTTLQVPGDVNTVTQTVYQAQNTYDESSIIATMVTLDYVRSSSTPSAASYGRSAIPKSLTTMLSQPGAMHASFSYDVRHPASTSGTANSARQALGGGSDTPLADLYARMHAFM
jgi:hypothetical protein